MSAWLLISCIPVIIDKGIIDDFHLGSYLASFSFISKAGRTK